MGMKVATMFEYGTAGFRAEAASLEAICPGVIRMCEWLSYRHGGLAVGLVITASHNKHADNGFKFVMPDGSLLPPRWERLATTLVNTQAQKKCRGRTTVLIGRDTRASGERLLALLRGSASRKCRIVNLNLTTTPELHSLVRAYNRRNDNGEMDNYFQRLIRRYRQWIKRNKSEQIVLDVANGAGIKAAQELAALFPALTVVNNGTALINQECGADHVKTHARASAEAVACPQSAMAHHYAFDGDADRVIAYRVREGDAIDLIDGDKISALIATYVAKHVDVEEFRVGVVHTAYSNGAFIEYVKKLSPSIKVECVPTGVKHLHRAARKYDVGIYFEANGHGTIVHGRRLRRQSRPTALQPLMRLANPLVGCAVADLLICEGILGTLNMGFEQWANLYLEKPSVLLKLPVMDKSRYRCNLTEERLLEPEQLQRSIDEIVHEFPGSRAFVRPSGTEHVLRVYVEAMTVQAVQSVAESLRKLLEKY